MAYSFGKSGRTLIATCIRPSVPIFVADEENLLPDLFGDPTLTESGSGFYIGTTLTYVFDLVCCPLIGLCIDSLISSFICFLGLLADDSFN